jgi:hypothetical protein
MTLLPLSSSESVMLWGAERAFPQFADEISERIVSFLNSKERVVISSVNRSCHRLVANLERHEQIVRIYQLANILKTISPQGVPVEDVLCATREWAQKIIGKPLQPILTRAWNWLKMLVVQKKTPVPTLPLLEVHHESFVLTCALGSRIKEKYQNEETLIKKIEGQDARLAQCDRQLISRFVSSRATAGVCLGVLKRGDIASSLAALADVNPRKKSCVESACFHYLFANRKDEFAHKMFLENEAFLQESFEWLSSRGDLQRVCELVDEMEDVSLQQRSYTKMRELYIENHNTEAALALALNLPKENHEVAPRSWQNLSDIVEALLINGHTVQAFNTLKMMRSEDRDSQLLGKVAYGLLAKGYLQKTLEILSGVKNDIGCSLILKKIARGYARDPKNKETARNIAGLITDEEERATLLKEISEPISEDVVIQFDSYIGQGKLEDAWRCIRTAPRDLRRFDMAFDLKTFLLWSGNALKAIEVIFEIGFFGDSCDGELMQLVNQLFDVGEIDAAIYALDEVKSFQSLSMTQDIVQKLANRGRSKEAMRFIEKFHASCLLPTLFSTLVHAGYVKEAMSAWKTLPEDSKKLVLPQMAISLIMERRMSVAKDIIKKDLKQLPAIPVELVYMLLLYGEAETALFVVRHDYGTDNLKEQEETEIDIFEFLLTMQDFPKAYEVMETMAPSAKRAAQQILYKVTRTF